MVWQTCSPSSVDNFKERNLQNEVDSYQTRGLHQNSQKTEAIQNLNPPNSLKQLGSFPNSIIYLSKFIPNAASLRNKLGPLLKKKIERKIKKREIANEKTWVGGGTRSLVRSHKNGVANI